MVYTTNQLISDSFYASGVVAREFETVSGAQIADGLQWLNDILTDKRVEKGMIPYETTYNFTAQVGQEKYFIPNLVQIDTLVFYLESVRYSMVYTKRNQYFGSPRVQNIESLPYQWYWERAVGGGNLYIYFSPDQQYPMEIHGMFNVNPVALGQDISSNVTIADLGVPTFFGNGSLSPGQLVVNGIDLMGIYPNIGALINYINSGIIPSVRASIVVNDFVLSSTTEPPVAIYVQSNGYSLASEVGTRFIGNVAAFFAGTPFGTIYNNGVNGVGATLTAGSPGVLVVDDYIPVQFDRILVQNPAPFDYQNGSYSLTTVGTPLVPWVLTRTTNYDQSYQIQVGDLFTVLNGLLYDGDTFEQTQQVSVIGTSPIDFTLFNGITFSNFSTIGSPLYQVFNANGFDQFFITYLRYSLADRICTEYNYEVPAGVTRQLAEYQAWIAKKSRTLDLRMEKKTTLQQTDGGGGINYPWVNLGRGWWN
jgi:hypothetical protein